VKNRFSTLCKKRAKYEALAKENNVSYTNSNNKRIIFRDAESEPAVDFKKMRYVKL
jgi:myb proto-oncogene protein